MLWTECDCLETYEQPKLFDPDHLLIICLDCGEVVDEIDGPDVPKRRVLWPLSTESTE